MVLISTSVAYRCERSALGQEILYNPSTFEIKKTKQHITNNIKVDGCTNKFLIYSNLIVEFSYLVTLEMI